MVIEEFKKHAEAVEAAACVLSDEEEQSADEWWNNPYLVKDDKGNVKHPPSVDAIVWWLNHPDSKIDGVRYDERMGRVVAENLPWDDDPHIWTDTDSSYLYAWMQTHTDGLVKSRRNLEDALTILVHNRGFDPLVETLDSLPVWDGRPRAETLFVDFLGAEDTPYIRAVTLHMLKGAIMRAYKPGCKFDECVILSSTRQGIGKSTLLRKLALKNRFFTDSLGDITSKEAAENLQGCWIVEIGELESLRKREAESVKLFMSRQEDRYRIPYSRHAETRKRGCIFVGTTNSTAFLVDRTGNRRFLPVLCDETAPRLDVFTDDAEHYINQVWAEILFMYHKNGPFQLVLPNDIVEAVETERETFTVDDPKLEMVSDWVFKSCNSGDRICILQVMKEVFHIEREDATKPSNKAMMNELSQILDLLPQLNRLKGKPKHPEYGQQRCWEYRSV